MPARKRTSTEIVNTPLQKLSSGHRERVDSFASDASDELDALDRELLAEEAAVANARACEPAQSIKDLEIDHVCEEIYERMEEQAMMELLAELEAEARAALADAAKKPKAKAPVSSKPAESENDDSLLWNIKATPAMMMQLAASVAHGASAVPCA